MAIISKQPTQTHLVYNVKDKPVKIKFDGREYEIDGHDTMAFDAEDEARFVATEYKAFGIVMIERAELENEELLLVKGNAGYEAIIETLENLVIPSHHEAVNRDEDTRGYSPRKTKQALESAIAMRDECIAAIKENDKRLKELRKPATAPVPVEGQTFNFYCQYCGIGTNANIANRNHEKACKKNPKNMSGGNDESDADGGTGEE